MKESIIKMLIDEKGCISKLFECPRTTNDKEVTDCYLLTLRRRDVCRRRSPRSPDPVSEVHLLLR